MFSHYNTSVILKWNKKKFNLRAKHKINNKISWIFFSALSLVLSYLLTYLGPTFLPTYASR